MGLTTALSEPRVLAHTKQALFPDSRDSYVVTDTQFAKDGRLQDGDCLDL